MPSRLSAEAEHRGFSYTAAPPERGRGVVGEAIGELAWAVTFYGADINLVLEGTLADSDRIALVVDDEPAPAS